MTLSGRRPTDVARDLDIPRSCLTRWWKAHLEKMDTGELSAGLKPSELAAENDRLRRELVYVTEQRDILKNDTHLRRGEPLWQETMSSLCKEHGVAMVCRTLGVSRSGHYAGKSASPSARELDDRMLKDRILANYRDNLGVYGNPHMDLALRAEGIFSSRRRIARLMRGRIWQPLPSDEAAILGLFRVIPKSNELFRTYR